MRNDNFCMSKGVDAEDVCKDAGNVGTTSFAILDLLMAVTTRLPQAMLGHVCNHILSHRMGREVGTTGLVSHHVSWEVGESGLSQPRGAAIGLSAQNV